MNKIKPHQAGAVGINPHCQYKKKCPAEHRAKIECCLGTYPDGLDEKKRIQEQLEKCR